MRAKWIKQTPLPLPYIVARTFFTRHIFRKILSGFGNKLVYYVFVCVSTVFVFDIALHIASPPPQKSIHFFGYWKVVRWH